MPKSLLPALFVTPTSAPSVTVPSSRLLRAAAMCRGHWYVATKVRCPRILNIMYVFLKSVGYFGLVAGNTRRVSWLPLVPTARPGLVEVTLVDYLRGDLLIVMVVVLLLLSVAVVSFYFGGCQPLQVCNAGIKPFHTLLLSVHARLCRNLCLLGVITWSLLSSYIRIASLSIVQVSITDSRSRLKVR
jgi:hypothetical protein